MGSTAFIRDHTTTPVHSDSVEACRGVRQLISSRPRQLQELVWRLAASPTCPLALCPVCVCSIVSWLSWPHGLHVARQAPLFMEFSRKEYWSGLPFPFPGNIPNQSSISTVRTYAHILIQYEIESGESTDREYRPVSSISYFQVCFCLLQRNHKK